MPSFIASSVARSVWVRAALCIMSAAVLFAATPRPVADLPIPMPSGQKIDLKKYRGKVVLVAVMSKDCDPCVKSIDLLNRVQKDFGAQGFQVVAAIGDPNAEYLLMNFVKQYRPVFPIGYLNKDQIIQLCDLGKTAQHATVPIFMFIDRKGTVRQQVYGNDQFFKAEEASTRTAVQSLLKQ